MIYDANISIASTSKTDGDVDSFSENYVGQVILDGDRIVIKYNDANGANNMLTYEDSVCTNTSTGEVRRKFIHDKSRRTQANYEAAGFSIDMDVITKECLVDVIRIAGEDKFGIVLLLEYQLLDGMNLISENSVQIRTSIA